MNKRHNQYRPIQEYGIIGNMETCALVGKNGSVDWCCLPHLCSASIFAKILDKDKGGYFSISPVGDFTSYQEYIANTNVLQTIFENEKSTIMLTDFMPTAESESRDKYMTPALFRKLHCEGEPVQMSAIFQPKFNYVRDRTLLEITDKKVVARSGEQAIFLDSPVYPQQNDNSAVYQFTLNPDSDIWFLLRYGQPSGCDFKQCETALREAIDFWHEWVHSCHLPACLFNAPWHDTVVRSALVLKLLTDEDTGAIYAAPTTSLPESIGGSKNWDYRFNWIRDASFTIQAFHHLGHKDEAVAFLKWFRNIRSKTGSPNELKILYSIHGDEHIEEKKLFHLSGYKQSKPVRIGNAATNQWQLDIYGEFINSVYELLRYEEEFLIDEWDFIKDMAEYVTDNWQKKDAGIWELRGEPRHYTYSKLMAWVAIDRSVKIAEIKKIDAPLESWKKTRTAIKKAILDRGYNDRRNSFVMSFDSDTLDASTLLIPLMGLLQFHDKRTTNTIQAIRENLATEDGLVYRFEGADAEEGFFVICSYWLVINLVLQGNRSEAERIFGQLLKYLSPLGLLAEEIDPETGDQLGNYPQAFSHIGLINAALYLGKAKYNISHTPEPIGRKTR